MIFPLRIISYEVCNKYFLTLELIASQWFNAIIIIRIIIFVSFLKSCVFLDLMKLKRIQDNKKKAAGSKKKTDNVLSAMTPGLCVDFHPTVSWPQLVWSCSFIQAVSNHRDNINSFRLTFMCVFLLYCIEPTGFQYLLGWHMGGPHPQVLLFQQSAFSGDLSKALCKSLWIKPLTRWYLNM